MSTGIEILSEHRCFGGRQLFLRHNSREIGLPMKFSVFLPPRVSQGSAAGEKVPVLTYLAGLTCTEETFMTKAGAQRGAAELGLILVAPDTSPRGTDIPGQSDDWDFGLGAGFYVDATEKPWAQHWRMYSYVNRELPELIAAEFPVDTARRGIFGHSMGGHGALISALKNPDLYRSVSAFAPISAPSRCPWGQKAFTGYLGGDKTKWNAYDASVLVGARAFPSEILIDQGLSDQFLKDQLYPEAFEEAATQSGQRLSSRRHAGYDHGYYFIQSFVADHLRHHARLLAA
ncbi:MAG TPA: S-formylglutathione hydrolase [Dongiaceae bacterium]